MVPSKGNQQHPADLGERRREEAFWQQSKQTTFSPSLANAVGTGNSAHIAVLLS